MHGCRWSCSWFICYTALTLLSLSSDLPRPGAGAADLGAAHPLHPQWGGLPLDWTDEAAAGEHLNVPHFLRVFHLLPIPRNDPSWVRAQEVDWSSSNWTPAPLETLAKCPWATHWTPYCSWLAGSHLAWQPPPSVSECVCVWQRQHWEALWEQWRWISSVPVPPPPPPCCFVAAVCLNAQLCVFGSFMTYSLACIPPSGPLLHLRLQCDTLPQSLLCQADTPRLAWPPAARLPQAQGQVRVLWQRIHRRSLWGKPQTYVYVFLFLLHLSKCST